MKSSIWLHAAILSASLIAAYVVWTRDIPMAVEGIESNVEILTWRGPVNHVRYEDADRIVELQQRKDAVGNYYWANVTTWETQQPKVEPAKDPTKGADKTPPAKAADKETDAKATTAVDNKPQQPAAKAEPVKPTPPPVKVKKEKEFLGDSEPTEQLLKELANFRALRKLGTVSADKLKEFELADSKSKMVLTHDGEKREFVIGGRTYGNSDMYVLDTRDNAVYVVMPRLLQDLQYAEFRLMERDLQGFASEDVDRIIVQTAGKQRAFVQQNRRDPATAYWADETSPQKKKELHTNWATKLLRLRAMEYTKSEALSGLTPVAEVVYKVGGQTIGGLRLFKKAPPPGATPPAKPAAATPEVDEHGHPKHDAPASTTDYYAVSDHSRGPVKLSASMAEEIVRDLDAVMKE